MKCDRCKKESTYYHHYTKTLCLDCAEMNKEKEQYYLQLLCEAEKMIDRLLLMSFMSPYERAKFDAEFNAWKEAKDNG